MNNSTVVIILTIGEPNEELEIIKKYIGKITLLSKKKNKQTLFQMKMFKPTIKYMYTSS